MKIAKSNSLPISKLTSILTLGAVVVVSSAGAQTIIYNNLGAAISGTDLLPSVTPAYDSFTSSASAQSLTSLQLGLSGPGGTGTLTIGLYNDSSTSPGAMVATLGTVDDSLIPIGYNVYSVPLLSSPVLAPSTRYWIGLSDNTGSEKWAWSLDVSGVGVGSEYLANSNTGGKGVPNNPNGPYLMEVITAVPEPTTLALAGLGGLASLVAFRHRK